MKKRIMILGAGIYQVPLIHKARQMGWETVVVSPRGPYPGLDLSDIHIDLDTRNVEDIVDAAWKYEISAVITAGTDVSVPAMGAVVDALKLRGPSHNIARMVSSKIAFREFLGANGLNFPRFSRCEEPLDAWGFHSNADGATVIKPDDSSGSRGVAVLERNAGREEVFHAYRNALGYSPSGSVCVEEFLPGIEAGGEAFLADGEIRFFTTTCKHMDGVIVIGHTIPGTLGAEKNALAREEIRKAASALKYANGPLNFDIMISEDKAIILEIGLRSGGNGILDIIKHGYQVDLTLWHLAYVTGQPIHNAIIHKARPASSYVFGAPKPGRLSYVSSLPELKAEVPEIIDLVLAKRLGDSVEPMNHNANQVGYILLGCGADRYDDIVGRIRQTLRVEVEA